MLRRSQKVLVCVNRILPRLLAITPLITATVVLNVTDAVGQEMWLLHEWLLFFCTQDKTNVVLQDERQFPLLVSSN